MNNPNSVFTGWEQDDDDQEQKTKKKSSKPKIDRKEAVAPSLFEVPNKGFLRLVENESPKEKSENNASNKSVDTMPERVGDQKNTELVQDSRANEILPPAGQDEMNAVEEGDSITNGLAVEEAESQDYPTASSEGILYVNNKDFIENEEQFTTTSEEGPDPAGRESIQELADVSDRVAEKMIPTESPPERTANARQSKQELQPPPPPSAGASIGGDEPPRHVEAPAPAWSATNETPVRERVIERRRGTGILPALVVHFLSRRRDKILGRKHEKDVKGLKQEIADNAELQSRRHQTLRQSQDHLQAKAPSRDFNKNFTSNEVSGMDMPPIVALEREMAEERRRLAEAREEAELRQRQAVHRMLLRQKREKEEAEDNRKSKEDKQRLAAADMEIDKDVTPEKEFDRRHEVLDKQSVQPVIDARTLANTTGTEKNPVPISHVLSERGSYSQSEAVREKDTGPGASSASLDEIYKKSLKTGFYVGVAVIIVGALAYLIF